MTDGKLPSVSDQDLIAAAKKARAHAYAPYSRFLVGAALLTRNQQVFSGCNVENASYGATLCAERVAIGNMVSSGAADPQAIAIYTEAEELTMPCGMCRQVLSEFASDLRVLLVGPGGLRETSLSVLFPSPFLFSKED